MNRIEYKYELKDIQKWHEKKSEGLYCCWEELDYTNRHIAASLCALVDIMIAKELHQLSQEKEESGDGDDND